MIGSFSSDFSSVYTQLTSFAKLENFWSLFDTAFGSSYDFATAASFRSQWQSQDFSLFPQIEIVSDDVLGSAKGAYGISTNRIYLSDQFVSRASQQSLDAVILEEFGHFVDAQVNATDTLGDEGELFSDLLRGVKLSPSELTRIQTEDDHAVVIIGGQPIAIEMAFGATGYIQFGTSYIDSGTGISADSSGNVYVTGSIGGSLSGNSNYSDAFVAKYDASGTQVWIKRFGSSSYDFATGISTNSSGNIYVTGYTSGSLPGNSNLDRSDDAFVAKYDASGNQLWIKQFGSSGGDYTTGISTDSNGNSYVTGYTRGSLSSNFNLGDYDAFIAKYDASGNQLWIKQFGTSAYDKATEISTDSSGNIYVSADVSGDTFVAKYDASGTQLWINQFRSSVYDNTSGISTDNSGNIYVSTNTFLAKYDASGTQVWIKQFGSFGGDYTTGISTDSSGHVYVTGNTSGSLSDNANLGSNDAFVAKYDASGNLLWVKQFGSSGSDFANGSRTDSNGHVYVTGNTSGNLPSNASLGDYDAFIVGFDTDGNLLSLPFFINDVTITEGNNGTKNATFIVTRFGDLTNPTTIDYATSDGTATTGSDYTATSGTLTFAINETTKTISVPILGDINQESDETFLVNLTHAANDNIITYGTGTIKDDDPDFKIAFDYRFDTRGFFTQERRNTLESAAKIWGSLISDDFPNLAAAKKAVVVNPQDVGSLSDYTQEVTLPAIDDLLIYVGSSTYFFDDSGRVTRDTLAVSYPSLDFGSRIGSISFKSSQSWFFDQTPNTDNDIPSSQTDFLYVALHEIGHILGLGLSPISNKIGAGGSLKSPNVLLVNNNQPIPLESDLKHIKEGFANNSTLMDPFISDSVGRILPTQYDLAWLEDIGYQLTSSLLDNNNITLAVIPTSVTEDGATNLVYTFTRTGATTNALTVNYGISGTADNSDYTGANPGTGKTITFAANSATATLTLDPTADTTVEPDETAILTLASGTGYTIGTTTPVTGTITNDDVASYGSKLTTPIIRFRNNDKPGTYLFAGEQESTSIRKNNKNFVEEGIAFPVAVSKTDPLMQPFYRFKNTDKGREGTYLFAGEQEAASIRKSYKNFVEEGLAFYAFPAGVGGGTTDFMRFQNKSLPGTYLFTGPSESKSVLTNPGFILEGPAFSAGG